MNKIICCINEKTYRMMTPVNEMLYGNALFGVLHKNALLGIYAKRWIEEREKCKKGIQLW